MKPMREIIDTRALVASCLTSLACRAGMAPLSWWEMHMTSFLHAVGWPRHSLN